MRDHTSSVLCNRTFTVAVSHFLCTFNVPLFVPLPYFIRGRFVKFSTRRNKSLHTLGHLSFAGKKGPLYCCLFSSISQSACLKLTVWNVIDILAPSSISRSRHLATKPSFHFACLYLFCCFLTPWLLLSRYYCFRCLGCRAVLRFSPLFLILAAIFLPCHFHRCRPFNRCSASNIAAFHSRLDLELPFLLWSYHRHIHFAVNDVFVVTISRRPILSFFAFLVVVLHVIFTPSCCSY